MALRAFREQFVSAGAFTEEEFADPEARKVRYDILWSQYENTVYRSIHSWATTYKTRYALYRYIRSVYNPAYRLGEFWKAHLWGGALDPEAGEDGCLPLETANEALRPFVAELWKWSNWATRKDIVSLQGAVYGDVILRVVDNTELGKVYIENLYPGLITELDKDPFGHIKGYTLEEERPHPIHGRPVTYKETAERDGDNVIYRTFLNDQPFAWNDVASEWVEPYGFIPMVHIQHNDVGLGWGWSELHPARSKMHELDDLASMLSDQLRKSVNAKWLFTGVKATSPDLAMETTETTARPEPGREEEAALYASDPAAKAFPLVYPLDVEGALLHLQEILKDFERDYPELKFDTLRVGGEVSGRALRNVLCKWPFPLAACGRFSQGSTWTAMSKAGWTLSLQTAASLSPTKWMNSMSKSSFGRLPRLPKKRACPCWSTWSVLVGRRTISQWCAIVRRCKREWICLRTWVLAQ